jgi:hypothetical protein
MMHDRDFPYDPEFTYAFFRLLFETIEDGLVSFA